MNAITIELPTATDALTFAARFARIIAPGTVIFLYGELGAGKTTFTRGLLQGFGYHGKVKSPTYTIVEPYDFAHFTLYHFDCYRLAHPKELEQIGIQDYFSPTTICIIEWPDKGIPFLPVPDLACYIDFNGDGREIRIEPRSLHGESIIKNL